MDMAANEHISHLVNPPDAVTLNAALTLLRAAREGADILAALEAGNAVLIAAGRKPVSIDDVLANMKESEPA